MDQRHEAIAGLIPDYVLGGLTDTDRETVERHLPGCADCRELLETARELRLTLPSGDASLTDHPDARILYDYMIHRDRLSSELASWVQEHLSRCDPCREAIEIVRPDGALPDPTHGPTEPGSRGDDDQGIPWWRFLSRTVLHPAAAAAYLVALIFIVPLALGPPEPTVEPPESLPAIVGFGPRLFGEEAVRGGESDSPVAAQEIPLTPDTNWLRLELVADLEPLDFDDGASLELTIEGPEQTLVLELSESDVDPAGSVSILLPVARLSSGDVHQVTIRSNASPHPLYRSRFLPLGDR